MSALSQEQPFLPDQTDVRFAPKADIRADQPNWSRHRPVTSGPISNSFYQVALTNQLNLPDVHALIRRQVHLLSRLDGKGRVPRIDIAHLRAAPFTRRVRIGGQRLAHVIFA
jgi:hypothetical protein